MPRLRGLFVFVLSRQLLVKSFCDQNGCYECGVLMTVRMIYECEISAHASNSLARAAMNPAIKNPQHWIWSLVIADIHFAFSYRRMFRTTISPRWGRTRPYWSLSDKSAVSLFVTLHAQAKGFACFCDFATTFASPNFPKSPLACLWHSPPRGAAAPSRKSF